MDNEILDTLSTLPDTVLVSRVKTLVGGSVRSPRIS